MTQYKSKTVRLASVVVVASLSVVAFLRGNHLLGMEAGIMFALVTGGALWLFVKTFARDGKISFARLVATSLLIGFVAFAIAFPAKVNSDLQHFIDKQATDRAARVEVRQVIESDNTFGSLSVATTRYKWVLVTVSGVMPTRDDFNRLRTRLIEDCPTLKTCTLEWHIRLHDSNENVDGFDHELFPPPENKA